ncbi:hypothetical protein Henu12_gp6 [Shigella phage Henu12]|jgi:hypothetical protein|uniref:Uncharacterized protein n=2 Tax=Mooglevirus moogle TaxID=1985304 RepID=A0A0A0RP26_9CAUD|nr:hypothetical protein CPT_Moogle118 [Citrobacter phage Moogle]AIW03855.1 hypothetical protein CPT_Moogle118 [Citrobacter phage Moogle]ARB06617.1 hypothetical protein CPT_Mijalis122 [Citrobacter phage Mijalis]EFG4626554.1 hypothetical protein [Escherichia coli]WKB10158.1 hypothetical protein Henu12_gp6 [Shigella phage Henu12]
MELNGKTIVAVFSDNEKDIGVAQVTYGNGEFLYGVIAMIGTRGDTPTFQDCVHKLEESVRNHWCLVWMNDNDIKERYAKIGIDIVGIEHVDLYQLTEKVMYESSNRQK